MSWENLSKSCTWAIVIWLLFGVASGKSGPANISGILSFGQGDVEPRPIQEQHSACISFSLT